MKNIRLLACMLAVWASSPFLLHAQIIYADTFSRGSTASPALLGGSQPTTDTNSNTWSTTDGNSGVGFSTDGTEAFSNNRWMPNAYLPVNGSSGVALNSSLSFTLSATISGLGSANSMDGDIYLTSNPTQGSAQFGNGIVAAAQLSGQYNQEVFFGPGYSQQGSTSAAGAETGTSYTLGLSYSSTTGMLTFLLNGVSTGESIALTPTQVNSITGVGFGLDNNWNGSTSIGDISNFSLTEATAAAPEPSSVALVIGGLALLFAVRQRHAARTKVAV